MKLLLNLIAPNRCLKCKLEGVVICDECLSSTSILESNCFICQAPTHDNQVCPNCLHKTAIGKLYSPFSYDEGVIKNLIHKMKFNRSKDAALTVAQILYGIYKEDLKPYDLITFVPTVNSRARIRGYDQSRVIAKELARLADITFKQTLIRQDKNRSVGSSKKSRQTKQIYKFVLKDADFKQILVIDDVVTTGSTLRQAVKALRLGSNTKIDCMVLAKTLLK